MFGLVTLLKYS